MKKVSDGITTLYAGGIYEKQSQYTEGVIGEVGQITDLTHVTQTIELAHTFRNPVVFVQPPSYNESDQTVVRILDVQADSFTVALHDAPNMTPTHTAETVSYIVLEEGRWRLPNNGPLLEVGTVSTAATRHASPELWESISFSPVFTSTPVVISQVQTNNDLHWVKTRHHSVSSTGFLVGLEEDEVQTLPHGVEKVGWLALQADPANGTWGAYQYEASETPNDVTGAWYTHNFTTDFFTDPPNIVGSMRTKDGNDPCYVRYQNLSAESVQFTVQEDTTANPETGHTSEVVTYLAIQGSGVLTGTMASPVVTKYYYFGGQRVAMRECVDSTCGDPIYLHSDHLGSASLATDDDGELISDIRYYPYGATRSGTVGTDYQIKKRYSTKNAVFANDVLCRQKLPNNGRLPIVDYRARYYDTTINQFVQPDTIVPDPQNPQTLNRYSYVGNNPLKFDDPYGFERVIIVYGIGYSEETNGFYAAAHTQYQEALAAGYSDDDILFTNVRSDQGCCGRLDRVKSGRLSNCIISAMVLVMVPGEKADSKLPKALKTLTIWYPAK